MQAPKLTMTLMEVYYAMREAGISISPTRISAGMPVARTRLGVWSAWEKPDVGRWKFFA